ncbi:MAG: helix-turn-helix transcriptional regulator [Actinomycetota bacterium]
MTKMLNYRAEPPSKRALKQLFIDAHYRSVPQDTLNCVAHLILVIENPEEMMNIALEYMVNKLSACRADAGFGTPGDRIYRPASVYYNRRSDPPAYTGIVFSNQTKIFQKTWKQSSPIMCENVDTNPLLLDSRKKFESIRSKSILLQRLVLDRNPVGIVCVDFTQEQHACTPSEIRFMESFCGTFLGPLAGISSYWHDPKRYQITKKPSRSELLAIKLAATGMSYRQIANELGKSIRTIENQLRNARFALNAANQAELISKCELWL